MLMERNQSFHCADDTLGYIPYIQFWEIFMRYILHVLCAYNKYYEIKVGFYHCFVF